MYLPNELLELILAYGFSWCLTTGRLVDKEWKQKIDEMTKKMYSVIDNTNKICSGIWKSPIYVFHINKKIKENVLLLRVIIEITKELKNKMQKKFTNEQCVNVYGYVFDVCSYYGFTDRVYEKIPSLLEYSFSQSSNPQLQRFFRIIFGNMIYYTSYHKLKSVNSLIEDYSFFKS